MTENSPDIILERALEISDPAERAAYLDRACAGDEGLRAEVDSLLAAHFSATGFLEPLITPEVVLPDEKPGDRIGRYKLLQLIGEGTFGRVWMAEQQEHMRRMVALKIIKLGMDTRQVVARFEAERQALALMDHPNIARVFDGGATESGRPYFVMERVRGLPITQYCDINCLSIRERIEIFQKVCQAVQHAHQKGIIHRDLKPSNILVTVQDDEPVPKVIDFGVAKALQSQLTEKTLFTRFNQWIGTPVYMSPEQAGLGGLDVDARSDVYSLGTILYELLTGHTPFDERELRETGYEALLQTIREQDVPKASARLSSLSREELEKVADQRGRAPDKLGTVIRGELDWILLKALERKRTRRYETANDLAGDLKRYSEGEPISAAPPSFAYQAEKLIRKHWKPAVVAGAFVLILIAATAVSTWQAMRAEKERRKAEENAQLAVERETEARASKELAEGMLYVSKIRDANSAWYRVDVSEAWRLLDEAQRNLRGWEYDYLYSKFARGQTLKGHSGAVLSVAFSPDGKRIVSGSEDKTLKVWDAKTGQETLTLKGHTEGVSSVAFSPDGKRIVSGSLDYTLKVWDAKSGQETLTLRGHTGSVNSVAFSPDGKWIVSGSWDNTLKVWDAQSGQETLTLRGHTGSVYSVAFSPDGKRIVSGSSDKTLKVWDAKSGQEMLTLKEGHSGVVLSVAFSPDGKRIVSGSWDNTLKVWDAQSGQETLTLRDTGSVYSVAFSPDGKRIVSGGWDKTLKVWDAESGREMLTLIGHSAGVSSVAFSPDGKRIVSGSYDKTLKVWDAESGREMLTLKGHTEGVSSVAFSPDGKRIVSGSYDKTLKVWDASTGQEMLTLKEGHSGVVLSVAFSPDGKRIVSGSSDRPSLDLNMRLHIRSWDCKLKVWDAGTGQDILTLKGHSGRVTSVAFSPDGKRIVSGGGDKTLKVWDAESGREMLTLIGHSAGVSSVAFSPDGKRIVSGSADLLSPSPGRKSTLKVWDAESGREMLTLKGHTEGVSSVAFSPDGKRIVSGSYDKTLKVWDASTGQEMLTLKEGHSGVVLSVAFSPDGKRIVSGGGDKTLMVWGAERSQEPEDVHPQKALR